MEPIFLGGGEAHHRRWAQSEAAASLLLEGGDERPLRLWAEGKHVYLHNAEQPYEGGEQPPVLAEATERAVRDWWKSDPQRLDRLWHLVEEQVHARQGVREQLRSTLLFEGSLRDGWKDDAPTRPGCPRPYVIQAAINDLEIADRLDPYNWSSPRWAAVVRFHHDQAPDARSRSRWAARLARVEPDCDEVLAALRHWMLEDPTPWRGPLDFDGPDDGGRFIGGASKLLELALAIDEAWVADGLERLWRDGLTRPWLDHSGHEKPEAADGWWYDSSGFGSMPLVVRTLVDALIDRGRESVVVEAWPGPPDNPNGDDSERPLKLRFWLEKVVPKLAPDALLLERVDAWLDDPGTRLFPMPEAWELYERERSDMEPAAYALAEKLAWPQFAMLARTNPSKLLLVGQERAAGGLDPRYVLWLMIAEMTERGGEAPREVMAAREMVLDLDPPGS